MTASAIIGVIALILSLSTVVLALHTVRQATAKALSSLETVNARQAAQLESAFDRLMTIKWEDFAALKTLDDADEGGFHAPGEDEDDTEPLSRAMPSFTGDELALLNEDFPEEK